MPLTPAQIADISMDIAQNSGIELKDIQNIIASGESGVKITLIKKAPSTATKDEKPPYEILRDYLKKFTTVKETYQRTDRKQGATDKVTAAVTGSPKSTSPTIKERIFGKKAVEESVEPELSSASLEAGKIHDFEIDGMQFLQKRMPDKYPPPPVTTMKQPSVGDFAAAAAAAAGKVDKTKVLGGQQQKDKKPTRADMQLGTPDLSSSSSSSSSTKSDKFVGTAAPSATTPTTTPTTTGQNPPAKPIKPPGMGGAKKE